MKVIDPGHIYQLDHLTVPLTFVKRSGGAVTYPEEWPGLQTQAVMRAVIHHLQILQCDPDYSYPYRCWQLGSPQTQVVHLQSIDTIVDVVHVLIDRSRYLNKIIYCLETGDACGWMSLVLESLKSDPPKFRDARNNMRMAMWSYEARAYRRKMEGVNRLKPEHDDSATPKPWRDRICHDIPFTHENIEIRPCGSDGHILINS